MLRDSSFPPRVFQLFAKEMNIKPQRTEHYIVWEVDTAFKDEKVVEVVDGKVMRRKTK